MRAFSIGLVLAFAATTAPSAQTTATQSGKKGLVSPDWIRKPTGDEIAANYPRRALEKDQTGKALIKCEIDESGRLKDCAVIAETPRGADFGLASLRLSNRFQAPPGLEGGIVIIPMHWLISDHWPQVAHSKNPHFIAAPTADEVVATFPKGAIGRADRGLVRLRCEPRGCTVSSAEPAGLGFEQAALTLSKKFKLDPVWFFNLDATEVQYEVSIQLAPSNSEVWKTRPLGHIDWVETADPQIAQAAFPAEALKAGLSSGSAIVACTVAPNGVLSECGIDSENPQGLGFGRAIAYVAQHYVMNPWTDEGLPAGGAHMKLQLKLVHEADPSPASAPPSKP